MRRKISSASSSPCLPGLKDYFRGQILSALQDRIGIARARLTRHSHDRRRGGKNFQTTTTAARTRNAAKRIDAHVSNLSRRAIHTAPQLAIENYAAADAGAERHADNRLATDGRALPHLADSGSVRIVLENRRQTKLLGQSSRETKAIETRKIWRLHDRAFFNVYRTGHYKRDSRYLVCVSIFLKFVNCRDDRVNYRVRIPNLRRILLEPRLNSTLLIDSRARAGASRQDRRRKSAFYPSFPRVT